MPNYYKQQVSNRHSLALKLKLKALLITGGALAAMALLIAGISNMSVKNYDADQMPQYKIDFSGNPDGIFNLPAMVRGKAQGKLNGERCLKIEVTLDENAEGLIFEKKGGANNLSNVVYYVNETQSAPLGTAVCMNGNNKALISFCAEGTETSFYRVMSVPRLKIEYDSIMHRGGGEKIIRVNGLESESIEWKVLNLEQSVISNTEMPNKIIVSDKASSTNNKIVIEVSGTHKSSCGGSYSCRQKIVINYYESLDVVTTPQSSVCAAGGSVIMHAIPSGGKQPYSYVWKNQEGHFKSFTQTCTTDEPGIYTVEVTDATQKQVVNKQVTILPAGVVLPSMIQAKDISQTSSIISWNQLNGVTKYKVRYKPAQQTDGWQYAHADAGINELRLKKLSPETEYLYQIMIYGKSSNDTSGWSKMYRFTTLSECVPATQLGTKITFNKLMCKWKLNPYNTRQVLLLRPAGKEEWTRRFKIGADVSAVFLDNLKADVLYEWMIVSYCKSGEVPSQVQQFKATGESTTSIALH